ncbi:MAG: carboxypeptidase regulatory-like domain-containing protein [Thermoanaerobaculia bacterium]
MVLNRLLPIGLTVFLLAPALRAGEGRPGEVVLPLKDYLALVEAAETAQKARAERARLQAAPLVEIVSQRVAAFVEDGEARVTSEFEVLVQGRPDHPVALPLAGYPATVEVLRDGRPEPGAAVSALHGGRGGVLLVAPEPGKYQVRIQGRTEVENLGGIGRLTFPPAAAPVAVTEIDLPAETSWTAPGGVVVEDREQGGRRTVQLASKRGEAQVLELKRRFDSAEADRLLVQTVALTLFQLRPEGPRRHDVVLYEVSRGSLPSFTVDLPPGVEVEQAGTDEGPAVPDVENGKLTVHRHRQLQGIGYLVLTSTPPANVLAEGTALTAALPTGIDVRARYLAVASSIAAEARPLPDAAWARVDLEDLPASLSEALEVIDLAAAWRLSDASVSGARLAVSALPPAPSREEPVRMRDTTTLLTVDGTLLHRDLFTLGPVTRAGAALDLILPAGAQLWSARVGTQAVRPLDRGGRLSIPLGFGGGAETVVEVVAVLEKAVPGGRSELGMELAQVMLPVLEHRWRLLLPEGNRYRFRSGDLRPTAQPAYRVVYQPMAAQGLGGTSSVYGQVVDDQGSPLPGVTMTLLGGANPLVQITDAQGRFRFVTLPPGSYSLKAELEGFSTQEFPNVQVVSGGAVTLEMTMSSAVEDVITVTAESPMLDERRTGRTETIPLNEGTGGGNLNLGRRKKISTGATVSQAELDKIPTARDSFAILDELKQGLVGGVRPLPVAIPESGKALYLTGVLPPAQVSVKLDVKAKR